MFNHNHIKMSTSMGVNEVEQKANLHKNIERMWVIEMIYYMVESQYF